MHSSSVFEHFVTRKLQYLKTTVLWADGKCIRWIWFWFWFFFFSFVFYLGFFSQTFTIRRTAGEGEGYLINSSPPLPPASLAGRLLQRAHLYKLDSNREPLASEHKPVDNDSPKKCKQTTIICSRIAPILSMIIFREDFIFWYKTLLSRMGFFCKFETFCRFLSFSTIPRGDYWLWGNCLKKKF